MLVRIETRNLRTGMFVARVEGSWIHNPFWRSRFLLSDPAQIARLSDAGVESVFIDTRRGVGPVADPAVAVPLMPGAVPEPIVRERRAKRRAAPDEFDRARALVERSKVAVTRMFGEARLGRAVTIDAAVPLVDDIAASVACNPGAIISVTRLKSKTEYTYLHSVAVCALMINLARHLGIPEDRHRDIGLAGLLHDIGKMATPIEVLDKPGPLTESEMSLIRDHPEQGHAILRDNPDVPAAALDVCLHHHERVDGGGYPFGLGYAQISLYARMSAICDVYDAVTSDRVYKAPWLPNVALARMLEWEGHFDPNILEAFIHSIGIPPVGGLVRLGSNHLALVLDPPAGGDPCAPPARRFYCVETAGFVPPADTATDATGDRVIAIERGAYWFGDKWPEIRSRTIAGERLA